MQIGRQILGHLLGQRRDERALTARRDLVDLADQIVDLPLDGPDEHLRVKEARGPDDLLRNLTGAFALVFAGRRGDVDRLMDLGLEFIEFQRPVVIRRRQAEAVVHKTLLAGMVAVVHGAHLRQRDVALVHEQQEIVREIVDQRGRRRAGRTSCNDAGVIFNAGAEADLRQHLQIVLRPLPDALRFEQLIVLLEEFDALPHLRLDVLHRAGHFLLRRDVMRGGIDGDVAENAFRHSGDGVDLADAVDLIAEKLHADGAAHPVGRVNFHRIAADAVGVADEIHVVALVADIGQTAHQLVAVALLPGAQGNDHALVVDRVAQTVDAGDGGNDDHIPALGQRGSRAVAQALDLVVDGGVLLNIGVGVRDIRLWLIVVIVGNEIFHGVVREELPELRAELRRQRLVVRQHERRPVQLLDDVRHGKGLAGAGDAKQDLLVEAHFDAVYKFFDGLRLVAGRLIFGNKLKIHIFSFPAGSEQSVIRQRDKISVRDDHMIDQRHADRVQRRLERGGGLAVLPAREGQSARMVVRHDHGGRVVVERGLYDLPRGDGRHVDGAPVDERAVEHLALGVQTQQIHDLLRLTNKARRKILCAFVGRIEDRFHTPAVHHVPPLHLHEQQQEVGGAFAHAVDLQKLRARCLQHARKAPKAAEQCVRDLVRVPARNGVVERDL